MPVYYKWIRAPIVICVLAHVSIFMVIQNKGNEYYTKKQPTFR